MLTTFNFLEKTRACLESFFSTNRLPSKLLVIDNNSTDGTLSFLEGKGLQVLRNPVDTSLAAALNQGFRYFLGDPAIDFIAWIHNDMLFFPGWLEELIRLLKENPSIGKLAPYNLRDDPAHLNPEDVGRFMRENRGQLEPGNGCPWVMRRAVVEEVGFFDEGYLRCGGYEDWDYNNRLLEKGYQVLITKGSVVWHEGMGTRRHIPQEEAARHNAARYAERWGPGSRV